jgi:putative flippase GtrA
VTLARFLAVGASNTLLTLSAYALLLAAGLPYLAALAPAYALGALNGYTLNRTWTFRAGAFRRAALARYGLLQAAGLGLNAALLAVLVRGLGADELLGQGLVLPLVTGLLFVANRRWVFAADQDVLPAAGHPRGA